MDPTMTITLQIPELERLALAIETQTAALNASARIDTPHRVDPLPPLPPGTPPAALHFVPPVPVPPVPAPAVPAAPVTPPPAPIPAAIPTATPPAYTHDALKTAAAPLVRAGRANDLWQLLAKYQADSVDALPAAALGAFAADLRIMGAQI